MTRTLAVALLALSPAFGGEIAARLPSAPSVVALPSLPSPAIPSAAQAPASFALQAAPLAPAPQAAAPLPDSGRGDDPYPTLTSSQRRRQRIERVILQTQRALTLPVHLWPFSKAVQVLAHGEAFAGLSPASAARAAEQIKAEHGAGAVVGRLSWELRDEKSVRGAYRSYSNLIDEIVKAKKKDPKLDVALSLDAESLGGQLAGLTSEQRRRIAHDNIAALARRAQSAGIPVELDIGASAVMPILLDVAHDLVRTLRMPVRLALSGRYEASLPAVRAWADLARQTGLKLGVRLVKGSFIEGDRPGTVNTRAELIAAYKKLITEALERHQDLDVAVATHSDEIWAHAEAEARRLGASFTIHSIRGINPQAQAKFRAAGRLSREYLSFGVDTPVMALMETWTNWRQRRALRRRGVKGGID